MTDWRALCAELADTLERAQRALRFEGGCSDATDSKRRALIDRARAALAAEPVVEGPTPSDEELLATLDQATANFPPRHPEAEALNGVEYQLALELRKVRAVLARFGHQPAPAPAEGEVAELVEGLKLISDGMDALGHESDSWFVARAATLLSQRHPTPVPVSERLPGPEDLNDKGECWEWDPTSDAWVLVRLNGLVFRPGPWLPAHALPLPSGEVEK